MPPEGWIETTLGEAASWRSGKSLPAADRDAGGQYPLMGANGEIGRTDRFLYDKPVITVGRVGAYGEVHRTEGPAWVSDNALVAEPMECVTPAFLYYALKATDFEGIVGGTNQPVIAQGRVQRLPILVPPVPEQRRIVDLLDAIDAAIDAASEQQEAVAEARKALLADVMQPREEWAETTLGEVATWGSGGTPNRKHPEYFGGDIPWVKSGELRDSIVTNTGEFLSQRGLAQSSAKMIPAGTVMIAMYGATIGRVGIASMACATNQAVASATADERRLNHEFLFWFLLHQRSRFVDAGQGAAQPNISQGILRQWPIALPPLSEQAEIAAHLRALAEVDAGTLTDHSSLEGLRGELLTDLLSGDHRIPESYDRLLETV